MANSPARIQKVVRAGRSVPPKGQEARPRDGDRQWTALSNGQTVDPAGMSLPWTDSVWNLTAIETVTLMLQAPVVTTTSDEKAAKRYGPFGKISDRVYPVAGWTQSEGLLLPPTMAIGQPHCHPQPSGQNLSGHRPLPDHREQVINSTGYSG